MNELRIFYVWDDKFIRIFTSNAMTKRLMMNTTDFRRTNTKTTY